MKRRTKRVVEDQSRRTFLQTISTRVPTVSLLLQDVSAGGKGKAGGESITASGKFTPIDLRPYFTASPADFGPRERAKWMGREGLIRVPAGKQSLKGIPFWLGPEGVERKSWIVLSTQPSSWAASSVEIPLQGKADFICLAEFCDWDEHETPAPGEDVIEKVGQHLGDVVLVYAGGGEYAFPIRRRFEVNSPTVVWGHLSFNALPHHTDRPSKLTEPLKNALGWGELQTGVFDMAYSGQTLWACAVANPHREQTVKFVRFEAKAQDPLVVCGLTLFHGRENPLRYDRLSLHRFTLPEPGAEEEGRWQVRVDLGIVARTYVLSDFEPEAWLSAPRKGLGERNKPARGVRHLYAEVTASADATLSLLDSKTRKKYDFDLSQLVPGSELEARPSGARVEVLEHDKVWLHGRIVDSATGRPTPVRLAFRSKEGRYIPPYGHRTEINDAWFQDYGADMILMDTSFAYVDGAFQVELPLGEVFVEITKGFEYVPVRRKLRIEPGQTELKLEISRLADFRSRGWATGDTHVHFLSPSTAILEGQAEGVNLINLLTSQWGDLFTNVGDLFQGPLTSRDGETLVWVGTENRQHILGHIGLLGGQGAPVYPMCASGPSESYLGDPLWSSIAEWADACHEREGLAVAVHFPYPTGEIAADIVLGKIDAVEIRPTFSEHFNALNILDWYRYLNCGYRLPIVGGTDKMSPWMPVGAERTYAYLGQEEFNFANWAKAVRQGNTFMTSGPLLLFQADGQPPGAEITLGSGGGTIEVRAEAKSFVPFHLLEVVLNGRVVASREDRNGSREMSLKEKVQVTGPGWLAARCASRLETVTWWQLRICAHTSPVYLRVPDQELFSEPAAAYLLTLIEGSLTWVDNLATRPDPERFERVRRTFLEARERLHRRLHEHGVQH